MATESRGTPVQLDLMSALAEASAGMAEVEGNEAEWWKASAMRELHTYLLSHKRFSADGVRRHLFERGIREPHHPNMWSVLLPMAAKRGWCSRTAVTIRSARSGSHAHHQYIWESSLC